MKTVSIDDLYNIQNEVSKMIDSMTHQQLLEFRARPQRITEEAAAAGSFPEPVGEPCYPNAIDNDGMRYFAPLLTHRDVNEVRVGGIPWDRVSESPRAGQWYHDKIRGVIELGGITGNYRVIAYLAQ